MSTFPVLRHVAPGAAFADPLEVPLAGGRLVEVSGQIGFDDAGGIPADFAAEVRSCFAHVERSLARAGATFADVIRLRTYLTDLGAYATFAAVRAELFADAPPASTAVGVASLLLGARVEIEATAYLASAAQG